MSNVAELRDVLRPRAAGPEAATILFIDELHRFNKSQQDLLLPDVEEGSVRLIGATTHNPGFYVIRRSCRAATSSGSSRSPRRRSPASWPGRWRTRNGGWGARAAADAVWRTSRSSATATCAGRSTRSR